MGTKGRCEGIETVAEGPKFSGLPIKLVELTDLSAYNKIERRVFYFYCF